MKLLLALGLALAAVGPAGAGPNSTAALIKTLNLTEYRAGTVPPPFAGRTLDGRQLALADLRGKVVLLRFWATWCPDCRSEMALLQRLHHDYAGQGLVVAAINVREDRDTVGKYARELGLTFPVMTDPDGAISSQYGVIAVPATFVIARTGHALALGVGPRKWETAPGRSLIQRLLAEPAPARQ